MYAFQFFPAFYTNKNDQLTKAKPPAVSDYTF